MRLHLQFYRLLPFTHLQFVVNGPIEAHRENGFTDGKRGAPAERHRFRRVIVIHISYHATLEEHGGLVDRI